jgi:hypothetical protein
MSKRLVVTPNIEEVNSLVEGKGWSKAYFSETVMKKSRGWITEWKRAKNFPSPEEAVRMCVMLQTTPEEILTEQADIELVRGLLEQEREKGIKKDPIPKDEVVGSAKQKLLDALDGLSDSQIEKLIGIIEEAKKLL